MSQEHPPSRLQLRSQEHGNTRAGVHAGNAIVITDVYGVITRVTCAVPWGVFTPDNAVPGLHISLLLAEQERYFVRDILQRLRTSTTFTIRGAQVRLAALIDSRAYMDVTHVKGSRPVNGHVIWCFSLRARAIPDAGVEGERRLARRVDVLEQRLEIQQRTAERRTSALNALNASVQTLAQSLRGNRDYIQHQAEQLGIVTAERDLLIKLLREERTTANRARQAEQGIRSRLDFLTDTNWALSDSLDVDAMLIQIADMIVPEFADCCVVDLLDDERGVLTHAVVACKDPDVRARIEALPDSGFIDAGVTHPLRHAMISGYPSVSHNLDELTLDPPPQPAGFLDKATSIGISACVVTPLHARDHIFGTLTFASIAPGHRYRPEDLQFAEDLALPIAHSLDNVMLSHDVEQASNDRRDHLSMVSHELRSPMSVINGYAHLLQRQVARSELDRAQITMLSAELQDGVIQLAATASGLLLPKVEQTDIKRHPQQSIDLVALIATVVQNIDAPTGPGQSGRILVITSPSMRGYWDGATVGHAVEHMLSHALKHSTADSIIRVTLEQVGGNAEIAVQIMGGGSMESGQAHLQTPTATRRSASFSRVGGGPGLYMAEKIIAKHGGSIALENSLEHGSRLTLTLPIPGMQQPREQ